MKKEKYKINLILSAKQLVPYVPFKVNSFDKIADFNYFWEYMSQTVDLYMTAVYNVYNSKKHLESLVYNSGVIVSFLPQNMYFVVNVQIYC